MNLDASQFQSIIYYIVYRVLKKNITNQPNIYTYNFENEKTNKYVVESIKNVPINTRLIDHYT